MSRSRWFSPASLALFGLVVACGAYDTLPGQAAEHPNVIVILSDDQGWGDISFNGNTNISTPNIDSLGQQGASFDRFFVCPVCSPTRAEFLTGRYHPRGGVHSTSTGGERLDLDERTIAQVFSAAGYRTGIFGKWHNGSQVPYHPLARGFHETYGFTSGHWGDYFSPPLDANGQPVTGNGFLADDLTDHAVKFVEQNRDRPFFLYLPFNTPHAPMQVPDRWWNKFRERELKLKGSEKEKEDFTRAALAMVENIDWNVGRLLAKLDELKLAENTLVLFFCDNGPNSDRWNGKMKGRKGSTDEGGVRSPLLIRWNNHIPAGRVVKQVSGAIDLLPTLADLANVPVLGTQQLDGRSVKSLLTGESSALDDRTLFSTWNGKVSARTQRFRLDDRGKLFDMVSDPSQTTDVASEHAEVAEKLTAEVAAFRRDVLKSRGSDDRPFPVGHLDLNLTQLPARDGRGSGNVMRSAKAPNCSYFTNWSSTDDRLMWSIDVLTSGTYDVQILYACPKSDVGSEFEVRFEQSRLTGKITEAHDPPARGDENDRVSRDTESLVKDFKPLSVGSIKLSQGRGELTLQATKIAGKQVMEVRGLLLRRIADAK